jgi:hypothetical protein
LPIFLGLRAAVLPLIASLSGVFSTFLPIYVGYEHSMIVAFFSSSTLRQGKATCGEFWQV